MTTLRERVAAFISPPKRKNRRSQYLAAEFSRLTAGLAREGQYINNTLRNELRTLRARSRQCAQNNPHARRFFQMVVDNVCGANPFTLQAKVKLNSGKLDTNANKQIETEWKRWGKAANCDVAAKWNWPTMQRLISRTLAIDGEVFIRRHVGQDGELKLQIIDSDRLNEYRNEPMPNGNTINLGIEYNAVGKAVAYHIAKRRPQNWSAGWWADVERVPADEIYHLYIPEFAEQSRGIPWIYAALLNLVHLDAFSEAAVIAARIGASAMGFIESPDGGEGYAGDGTDVDGNASLEADPGQFLFLRQGEKVSSWNPKYPDAAVEPFTRFALQNVAAGIGVAYHNLSGDMTGVNYSSARIAELDERDAWMAIQGFVVDNLHQPIYEDWFKAQFANGKFKFAASGSKFDRYFDVYWQGRRWAWVDPKGEVEANLAAINGKLKSRTRVIAEQGWDIEDVYNEIAEENALAEQIGIAEGETNEQPKETETASDSTDDAE